MQSRKEFIELFVKGVGCFSVAAVLPFQSLGKRAEQINRRVRFPQGLASGDPTPDSVVLWTRAVDEQGDESPITLTAQISTSRDFSTLVAEKKCEATMESDFTVRLIVHDLEPDTRYFYRFLSNESTTDIAGRTRTAPLPGTGRQVNLAFASCQSYEGGFYHAYRELIYRDDEAEEADKIDFVLHLGDFIYETLGYGSSRKLPAFPSGGGQLSDSVEWAQSFALTLDDYRHLYKHYLMDPDLKEARARWPFVVTWDDHEFTDDSWQGMATYTTPNRPSQARKLAANRAWFEYIPAFLTGLEEKTERVQHARDFTNAKVRDADFHSFDEFGFSQEENNVNAVESLTIYRSFRWGKYLDLIVPDTRSYRTRHPVPGEIALEISGNARYIAPLELVKISDAGHTYNNGSPPDYIEIGGERIPNLRKNDPPGSMLGARQKTWFKDTVLNSDAIWKVCGSSVPMMPMRIDLNQTDPEASEVVFTTDTWEGYVSERKELMNFLKENRIKNFVSLSGDNHNSFAGILSDDFEQEDPEVLGAEFSICGISSTSVFSALVNIIKDDEPLRPLVTFNMKDYRGENQWVENLNTTFLWGVKSAIGAAKGDDIESVEKVKNPKQNPHLRYVDSNAYGIGIVKIDEDSIRTEMITIKPPVSPDFNREQDVLRTAHFRFPTHNSQAEKDLTLESLKGIAPFPIVELPIG